MKSVHKTSALIWIGVLIAILFSLGGCAPRPVPLGATLDTPEHHMLSGMKFLELGKYEDALREFDLTKQMAPAFSRAYVGSGLVRAYQGRWEEATRDLEEAQVLAKKKEEQVFASVGFIRLFTLGKDSISADWLIDSESAFEDAVKRIPRSSEAYFYMGKAYEETGDLGKAIVLFEKVLWINKTHVDEARSALNLIKHSQGN